MRKLPALLLATVFAAVPTAAPAQVLTGKKPIVPVPDHKIRVPLAAQEKKKHFQVPEGFEVESLFQKAAECRLSLRERTSFRGAKDDTTRAL